MYSSVVLGVENHLFEELIDNYKLQITQSAYSRISVFSTLARDKELTDNLSIGIPIETKELITLLTFFLAFAARSYLA